MKTCKKIAVIAFSIFITLCFQACVTDLELFASIDGYQEVIEDIFIYLPPPDDAPPPVPPSVSVKGYELIIQDGFDKPARFFENSFALTSIDGKNLFMDRLGNKFASPNDVQELCFDKYVFYENGLKGLKDLCGNVLLPAEYLSLTVYGNNVLADDDKNTYVFDGDKLISTVPLGKYDISLAGNNCLIVDFELCDLKLQPIMFGGFRAVSINDGIAKVKDSKERVGFYDILNDCVMIEPQYRTATQFVNGYAQVQSKFDGDFLIIDRQGDVKAVFNQRTFGFYDKHIFALDINGKYRLYDLEFRDTGLSFVSVYGARVYGNYIIDTSYNRIFSLLESQYVTESFKNIYPFEKGFVCETKNSFVLYDRDLIELGVYDGVVYDSGVLSVLHKGKYYYFSEISEENGV